MNFILTRENGENATLYSNINSNSVKAITLQGTTDAAGNINIGNLTTLVGRANAISAMVISPNSTEAELYAYGSLLFGYFHAHNDYSAKRDSTNVEFILYYK